MVYGNLVVEKNTIHIMSWLIQKLEKSDGLKAGYQRDGKTFGKTTD